MGSEAKKSLLGGLFINNFFIYCKSLLLQATCVVFFFLTTEYYICFHSFIVAQTQRKKSRDMFRANPASFNRYSIDIWSDDISRDHPHEYPRLALPLLISAPSESADFYLFRLLSLMSVLPLNFPLLRQSDAAQTFTLTQALKTNSVMPIRSALNVPLCRFGELDVAKNWFIRIGRTFDREGNLQPARKLFRVNPSLVQAVVDADTFWAQKYSERLAEHKTSGYILDTAKDYRRRVLYMFALAHGTIRTVERGIENFLLDDVSSALGVGMRLFGAAYPPAEGLVHYPEMVTAYTIFKMAERCGSTSEELQRTMRMLQPVIEPALTGVLRAYEAQCSIAPHDVYRCAATIFNYYVQSASLKNIFAAEFSSPLLQSMRFLASFATTMPPPAAALPQDTDGMDLAINIVVDERLSFTEKDRPFRARTGRWDAKLYFFSALKALGGSEFYNATKLYVNNLHRETADFRTINQQNLMSIYQSWSGNKRVAMSEYILARHAVAEPEPPQAKHYLKVLHLILSALNDVKRDKIQQLHNVNDYSAQGRPYKIEHFQLPARRGVLAAVDVGALAIEASGMAGSGFELSAPLPGGRKRPSAKEEEEEEKTRKRLMQPRGPLMSLTESALAAHNSERPESSTLTTTTTSVVMSSSSDRPPPVRAQQPSKTATAMLAARSKPPPSLSSLFTAEGKYISPDAPTTTPLASTPPKVAPPQSQEELLLPELSTPVAWSPSMLPPRQEPSSLLSTAARTMLSFEPPSPYIPHESLQTTQLFPGSRLPPQRQEEAPSSSLSSQQESSQSSSMVVSQQSPRQELSSPQLSMESPPPWPPSLLDETTNDPVNEQILLNAVQAAIYESMQQNFP